MATFPNGEYHFIELALASGLPSRTRPPTSNNWLQRQLAYSRRTFGIDARKNTQ
jgi:hypothetical protein